MSRVLINGQDVNMTDGFPEMNYDEWKALPKELRPDFTIIKDRNYTGEPLDNSVSVTADGVKTYATLLNELFALVDMSRVTRNSSVVRTMTSGDKQVFGVTVIAENMIVATYSYTANTTSASPQNSIHIKASGSSFYSYLLSGTISDVSSTVPTSGTTISLYYNIVSSGGVESNIFYKDIPIAGVVVSNYWAYVSSGVSASDYTAIGFAEGGIWDEKIYFSVARGNSLNIKSQTASYTIPSNRTPIRMFFVKNNTVNATPLT